jgi:succinate-acetate transporter protein
MGILAASWLAIGLVQATSSFPHRSGALGLMLLASAGTLGLSAITVSTAKPLPGAVFAIETVRYALAGIYELGGAGAWRDVAGIAGLVVVGVAAYCVLAFELEGQQRRPVLPTFRRGRGRDAVLGDPEAAVDGVFHDPGVRQTT